MAKILLNQPTGGQIEADVPDEGMVFRGVPGNAEQMAFVRKGNDLISLSRQQAEQAGINFGSLPSINPGSEGLGYLIRDIGSGIGGGRLKQGSVSDFQNLRPTSGETITSTLAPGLAGRTISSNLSGQLPINTQPLPSISGGISGQGPIETKGVGGYTGQAQALTGALGSADRTNQILRQASKLSGIPAQTFQNAPNQTGLIEQGTNIPPSSSGSAGGMGSMAGLMGQGTTVSTSPINTGTSLSDQYFQQLLTSLKPSQQETDYQQRLNDILAQQANVGVSRDLGIQAVGEQPIAMPFISGQQAAITGRAATQLGALGAQAVPLQQRLAMEQAKRQSAVDVTKLGLEYQQGKESWTAELAKEQRGYAQAEKIANLNRSLSDIYGAGSIGEYNFAKANGYKGTFTEYQNEDANRKKAIARAGVQNLTPYQTQATINQITGQFDNEPVVKNYNVVSEGYQFANNIKNKTTPSSADDIGLIYAFAKAMDPNSVVREGEYATVQKYAQSWAQAFGFKVERIFSNQPFLSQSAKQNMVSTIKTKFDASKQNYDNVAKEYQRRIEDAKSGKITGSITNYAGAYSNQENKPQQMKLNVRILNLQPDGTYR